MGHRYGNTHLPTHISIDEFKALKNEMRKDDLIFNYKRDQTITILINDIVAHCYKLNENIQPNVYQLVNIEGIIQDYNPVDLDLLRQQLKFQYISLAVLSTCEHHVS